MKKRYALLVFAVAVRYAAFSDSSQVFYDQFGNATIRHSDGSSSRVIYDQFGNATTRHSDGSSSRTIHDQFGNATTHRSDGSSSRTIYDQFGNAEIHHSGGNGSGSEAPGWRPSESAVQMDPTAYQPSTYRYSTDTYNVDQPISFHSGVSEQQRIREENAIRKMIEEMPQRSSASPHIDGYRRIGDDAQGGNYTIGDALGNLAVGVVAQELEQALFDERNERRSTRPSSGGGLSSALGHRFEDHMAFLVVLLIVGGIIALIRKLVLMFLNGILCLWKLEIPKIFLYMCIFLYAVNIYVWGFDFNGGWSVLVGIIIATALFIILSSKVKDWGIGFLLIVCMASFLAGVRYFFSGARESVGYVLCAFSSIPMVFLAIKILKQSYEEQKKQDEHDRMIAERKARPKRWNRSD